MDVAHRSAGDRTMRVLFIVFALTVMASTSAPAQFVTELEIGEDAYAFHGISQGRIKTFQSDQEAVDVVRRLMEAMGLPLRFEVRAGAVPNASAVLQKNGKRFIVYNVIFMEELKNKTGNYWSSVSIMAHEIGHHLSFHLDSEIDDHTAELEADYFSGFILGKLNSSLDEALGAMRALGSPLPSKSHPQREDRLQAIALGWKSATANTAANPKAVEKIPQQADRPPPAPETYRVLSSVSQGILNMRAGPGANARLIVAIPANATGVEVSRCVPPQDGGASKFKWCNARWQGYEGWVSSCCIVGEQSNQKP